MSVDNNKKRMLRTMNKFHVNKTRKDNYSLKPLTSSQQFSKNQDGPFERYKMRQNSIDEDAFQCFEGYTKIITELNNNKRLLMNRRHNAKPNIKMLNQPSMSDIGCPFLTQVIYCFIV
jgi:hypothetical protein